jgi:hypothetical protein
MLAETSTSIYRSGRIVSNTRETNCLDVIPAPHQRQNGRKNDSALRALSKDAKGKALKPAGGHPLASRRVLMLPCLQRVAGDVVDDLLCGRAFLPPSHAAGQH